MNIKYHVTTSNKAGIAIKPFGGNKMTAHEYAIKTNYKKHWNYNLWEFIKKIFTPFWVFLEKHPTADD